MRRQRGFTLLEMVVATTMVAVLAGSLYASLYTALKARRQALGLCDDVRRTHAALDFLQADLESAVVPNGVLAGAFDGVAPDQASSDEPFLSFHAVANDSGTGAGGIQLVEYSIEPSADGADRLLVRRVTRNLLATQQTDPPAEIICRGIQEVTVSFFDTTAWQQEWSSADQDNVLPKAVEIILAIRSFSLDQPVLASRLVVIPCGQGLADETTDESGAADGEQASPGSQGGGGS